MAGMQEQWTRSPKSPASVSECKYTGKKRDMTAPQFKRTFESSLSNLSDCLSEFSHFCRTNVVLTGEHETAVKQLEFCVAEALVNVVMHACERRDGIMVCVTCSKKSNELVVGIIDEGKSWPQQFVQSRHHQRIPINYNGLPENGLSWFITLDLLDCVEYRRVDGFNLLQLTKKLTPVE